MSRERVKPLNLQELLLNGGGVLVAVLTLVLPESIIVGADGIIR